MTDFGANIFDDAPRTEPTPPPPTRKSRSRKKGKAADVDAATAPASPERAAEAPPAVVEPEPAPPTVAAAPEPMECVPPASEVALPASAEATTIDEVQNPFPPAERYEADEPHHERDRRHNQPPQPRGEHREPHARDRREPHSHDRDRDRQHGRDRGQRHGQPFAPRPAEPERARQHPQQQAKPQPQAHKPQPLPPAAEPQAVTVNAVIDLDLLLAEAVEQQGELAMARLRLGLADNRAFGRGIALARNRNTPPAGFGLELFGDDFAGGVRLAGAAFGLAGPDRVVVLAPATKSMLTLARALHAAGHKVEVCGFTNPENHPKVRLLGRDCLFVP